MLSDAEQLVLRQAIESAETRTSGEIYVVIDEVADAFRLVPVLWAAVAALLVPWIGFFATSFGVTVLLLAQGLTFVAAATILSLPGLRHRCVPAAMADETAHRNARAVFLAHGVHLTATRTGVLIYVSHAPRRVEIVADAGIHERVGSETWEHLVRQISRHARAGRLVEGLCASIEKIGAILAEHVPVRPRDRNELPDRVIEI